jgi:hypothetical protein
MGQMLSVMYGGQYVLPVDSEWVIEDMHTANYLDIIQLLSRDLSGVDTARVNRLMSLDRDQNYPGGSLIEMKASSPLRRSQRLKDRESDPHKAQQSFRQ